MNRSTSYRLGIGARWIAVIFTLLGFAYLGTIVQEFTPLTELTNLASVQILLIGILVIANTFMFLGRNSRDPKPLTRFVTRHLSRLFGLAAQIQGFGVLGYLIFRVMFQNLWQPADGKSYFVILLCTFFLTMELDIYADNLWLWAQPRVRLAPPTNSE